MPPKPREAYPFGALDPKMGVSGKKGNCETCGLPLKDCMGHFGYIALELPVFHIGYFKAIVEVLQRICKKCGGILLNQEQKMKFLARFRTKKLETLQRKALGKQILELCKKIQDCPHCGAVNGSVKKVTATKIVHELYNSKSKDVDDLIHEFQGAFETAIESNTEINQFVTKAHDDISPIRCLNLFKKISNEDVELFDMDPTMIRPERMIMTHILAPPLCIRPSVPTDAGSNEDDLTMTLSRIIHINDIIHENIEKGVPVDQLITAWDHLQVQCALYINSETPGLQLDAKPTKPLRSLVQRLKGKHGRFRGNLSGKRVDFSGRTVISPDPNVDIDQVVIPVLVSKVLTYPERVNQHNMKRLKQHVINGPDVHPGANYVTQDGFKKYLKVVNRKECANSLKIGDVVERHLIDDDIVLFNRQPSLHRLSIMSHRVKVLPHRTFRFNICVCAPYNADFDGDEMNIHVPQTEEARAEAITLMHNIKNFVTPRNGEPLIAPSQDLITGAFILSRRNMFFTRSEFCMLCSSMGLNVDKIDLPHPTIIKPIEMWTGKQIFGLLINPTRDGEKYISLEASLKSYDGVSDAMCPNDGYVIIQNSQFISGNLDKSLVGNGSKTSIFYVIMKTFGTDYTAECMARMAKLTTRFLRDYGFSIGIDDVTPSERLTRLKNDLMENGYRKCDRIIGQHKEGQLKPIPGCDQDQTIEAMMTSELSDLRMEAGKICLEELHWSNAPLTMSVCGSKGSTINISQMIACVGQQTVGGSRIQDGFINRTLPHFHKFSKIPEAKGFVKNSFYTGLSPTEYFFHTMAGREGLVDTAVKTAETGYMQRRLIKALEDLSIQYDYSVRNSKAQIVQFEYGDDGRDPMHMEGDKGKPINFFLTMVHIQNIHPCRDEESLDCENIEIVNNELMQARKNIFTESFIQDEVNFIKDFNSQIESARAVMDDETAYKIKRLTQTQLEKYVELVAKKYQSYQTEPGEAVGAIAAQSIGEPGTQMTLKTFHFAGVASMNVTQGVPRIVEIINAVRNISTPIITAELLEQKEEVSARIVKGRIEKTTLGEIAASMNDVYDVGICYVDIQPDYHLIAQLQLELTPDTIVKSIVAHPKLKVKEQFVRIVEGRIRVYPTQTNKELMFYNIQFLRRNLPKVIVSGFESISRAIISKKQKKNKNDPDAFQLLVEGTDLRNVMGTPGVNGLVTKSNNVLEVWDTLGIEAARSTIISEIQFTMSSHGMSIDNRHVMLLGDIMTNRGEVLGITRHGIAKMKDSAIMLASFEQTSDHLFDATLHSRKDEITGVSESIIMGIPIQLGTTCFKLMRDVNIPKPTPRPSLFFPYQ